MLARECQAGQERHAGRWLITQQGAAQEPVGCGGRGRPVASGSPISRVLADVPVLPETLTLRTWDDAQAPVVFNVS